MVKKSKVGPEHHFYLCTGESVSNVKELAFVLDNLNDEQFSQHVNEHKNDFSSWVGDVFGRHELAQELLTKQDKRDTQLALFKSLFRKR